MNKKNDISLIYLIGGFIAFILCFLFMIISNPLRKSEKGRKLQALDPDKLSEGERWSKKRSIKELDNERWRRKNMRRNVYA